MPKHARYALGARIDGKLLDCTEHILHALYLPPLEKEGNLKQSLAEAENVKFLLQLAWESKLIATSAYADLAERVGEIQKMLWGWRRSVERK